VSVECITGVSILALYACNRAISFMQTLLHWSPCPWQF